MTDASDSDRLRLRVAQVVAQNDHINAYVLVADDGRDLPPFTAGAHLALDLPVGTRSYSILNNPAEQHRYVLGVAKEPRGRGGSVHIHAHFGVGTRLVSSRPKNHFPVHEGRAPALLIGGGIGITPLLSMAEHFEAQQAPWRLVHAVRDDGLQSFSQELAKWPGKVHRHVDAQAGGVLDIGALIAGASGDTHVYCCGPGPMLESFLQATRALAPEQVHWERFSADAQPDASGESFDIVLARKQITLRVGAQQTILQRLLEAGIDAPNSCGQGICGVCETRVLDGIPDHRDSLLSAAEREANDVMLICCSRSMSPALTLDL